LESSLPRQWEFGAFFFPAMTVLLATALSFVPAWLSSLEDARSEPREA
jgi:hypothetical protein